MPRIYLSPSTQQNNLFVSGGSEEYYMNLIADAMEPYLRSSGIAFTRNNPNETVGGSIRDSNSGTYDLHLALHSNAAPPANSGKVRGADFYYYTGSVKGKKIADTLVDNYKKIYPIPALVRAVPTTALVEITKTKAPTVLAELAFHDNVEDAAWIKGNIVPIAKNLVEGLCIYFGIPFIVPTPVRSASAFGDRGISVRSRPNHDALVLATIVKGEKYHIHGESHGWKAIEYQGERGYIR